MMLSSQLFANHCPQVRCELRPSIRGNMCWNAKLCNSISNESTSTGKSCHINQRNCFRPPSETINYGEKVGKTLGRRKRANQIHMNVIKESMRDFERVQRSSHMLLDFGKLARQVLVHSPICLDIPCQINLAATSLRVACMERCERLWMA